MVQGLSEGVFLVQGVSKVVLVQGISKAVLLQGVFKVVLEQDLSKAVLLQGVTKAVLVQGLSKAVLVQCPGPSRSIRVRQSQVPQFLLTESDSPFSYRMNSIGV